MLHFGMLDKIRATLHIPIVVVALIFKRGLQNDIDSFSHKTISCLSQEGVPLGAVMLFKYSVLGAPEVTSKRWTFKLVKGGARTYYFAAGSNEEMLRYGQVFIKTCIKNVFAFSMTIFFMK